MIPTITKILYATDLSKNAPFAFLYAVSIARSFDAKIIALHAIEPIPTYAIAVGFQAGLGNVSITEEERKRQ